MGDGEHDSTSESPSKDLPAPLVSRSGWPWTTDGSKEALVAGDWPLISVVIPSFQQGRYIARAILRDLRGEPARAFAYKDRGQMATIGRSRAIVQTGGLRYGGWLAWLTWLVVHIYFLVGFKNRLFVVLQWAWAYLTFRRGARLILDRDWRQPPAGD